MVPANWFFNDSFHISKTHWWEKNLKRNKKADLHFHRTLWKSNRNRKRKREIIHLGTLMRCLHISAMESDAIIQKMVEEELIGTDHRLISVKKRSMERRQIRRIDMKLVMKIWRTYGVNYIQKKKWGDRHDKTNSYHFMLCCNIRWFCLFLHCKSKHSIW